MNAFNRPPQSSLAAKLLVGVSSRRLAAAVNVVAYRTSRTPLGSAEDKAIIEAAEITRLLTTLSSREYQKLLSFAENLQVMAASKPAANTQPKTLTFGACDAPESIIPLSRQFLNASQTTLKGVTTNNGVIGEVSIKANDSPAKTQSQINEKKTVPLNENRPAVVINDQPTDYYMVLERPPLKRVWYNDMPYLYVDMENELTASQLRTHIATEARREDLAKARNYTCTCGCTVQRHKTTMTAGGKIVKPCRDCKNCAGFTRRPEA